MEPYNLHVKTNEGAKQLPDGRVWGILARSEGHSLVTSNIVVNLAEKTWIIAPISVKLGFPLQVHGNQADYDNSRPDVHTQALFFDADPDAPDFGSNRAMAKHWKGDAIFTRTDGKDIGDWQFQGLVEYIREQIAKPSIDIWHAKRSGEQQEVDRLKEKLVKRLRPEAFHMWFEEHRRRHLANSALWSDATSPVSATFAGQAIAPVCGTCFADQGEGENDQLLLCARCGVRAYCRRKCQKDDWKAHKPACSKSTRK